MTRPTPTSTATVDQSAPMIAVGKRLPGGDGPRLNGIVGQVEETDLAPPYALVTAAASLHWMDWDMVRPRCADVLTPEGPLALILPVELPEPWAAEMLHLRDRHTTFPTTVGASVVTRAVGEVIWGKPGGEPPRYVPATLSAGRLGDHTTIT